MKDLVAFLIILPILLYFILQPFHNEVTHLRGMALEITLNRGLQEAAVEGRFTDDIVQSMQTTLSSVGFDPSLLELNGGTITEFNQNNAVILYRSEGYIEGELRYPMKNLWAMPGLFKENVSEESYYSRSGSQMSEYLPR